MPVIADTPDPRSIITPDAFEVEPDLLGRPLATPWQRLVAILVDLAVIGLITLATKSFGILLGIVAAAFFIRGGFKRTPVRGSAFNRAMRFSVGCLGLLIGVGTVIGWVAWRSSHGHEPQTPVVSANGIATGQLGDAVAVARGSVELHRAHSAAEARRALTTLVGTLRGLGVDDDDIRQTVLGIIPEDAPWSANASTLVDEALGAGRATRGPPSPKLAAEVSALSTADALDAYAKLLRSGKHDSASDVRLAALRSRLVDTLAADTLQALTGSLDVQKSLAAARSKRVTQLTADLKKARNSGGNGVFHWLSKIVDELGFGFGWGTIYLTILTSWWKGQTVGKRLMKIRVLRLDGEPITWWEAFDRAGGYAAGLATGFLGFAQIFWDANRQCIHDRISGTVVVKDGAPKMLDWQEAL